MCAAPMLAATLLLMLHATPDATAGFLAEGAPRRIRLIVDEGTVGAMPDYENWTRGQLRGEYDRLETNRPGIFLPVLLIAGGLSGAAISGIWLAAALSSFFGVAVYVAVALTVAIVVFVGLVVIGAIQIYRNFPERRAMGKQMDEIEAVYRDRRCGNKPSQRPCPADPDSAPEPNLPAGYPPQVMGQTLPIQLAVF